jgi:hypothetical protein
LIIDLLEVSVMIIFVLGFMVSNQKLYILC